MLSITHKKLIKVIKLTELFRKKLAGDKTHNTNSEPPKSKTRQIKFCSSPDGTSRSVIIFLFHFYYQQLIGRVVIVIG